MWLRRQHESWDVVSNLCFAIMQTVVFCLVDIYIMLGKAFLPYLEGLNSTQLRLVTIYANRISQARTGTAIDSSQWPVSHTSMLTNSEEKSFWVAWCSNRLFLCFDSVYCVSASFSASWAYFLPVLCVYIYFLPNCHYSMAWLVVWWFSWGGRTVCRATSLLLLQYIWLVVKKLSFVVLV